MSPKPEQLSGDWLVAPSASTCISTTWLLGRGQSNLGLRAMSLGCHVIKATLSDALDAISISTLFLVVDSLSGD